MHTLREFTRRRTFLLVGLALLQAAAAAAQGAGPAARLPRWAPVAPTAAAGPQEPACNPNPVTNLQGQTGCGYNTLSGNYTANVSCLPNGVSVTRDGQAVSLPYTLSANHFDATDNNPVPGALHHYVITVTSISGSASASVDIRSGVPAQAPTPSVVALCDEVRLTYTPQGFVQSYGVFRDGGFIGTATLSGTFDDPTAPAGIAHYYQLRAHSTFGCDGALSAASSSVRPRVTIDTPATPTVTPYCGGVTVSWPNPNHVVNSHRIWRNGVSIMEVTSPATSFNDGGATPNSTYSISTMAFGLYDCESAPSAPSAATSPLAVPGPPQSLSALPACDRVTLQWGAASGSVQNYLVFRNDQQIVSVGGSVLAYDDPGASAGGTYQVQAVGPTGCQGAKSNSASATAVVTPATPTSVQATGGCGKITVTWAPSSGSVTGYHIYRGPTKIGDVGSAQLSFDDGFNPAPNSTYSVVAENSGCFSGYSSASAPATALTPPEPPGGVTASAGCGKITLFWNAASGGVTHYKIYRGGQPYQQVSASTLTFEDPLPPANTSYAVASVSNGCEGNQSAPTAALTALVTPGAPAKPGVTAGCGKVTVVWTAVAGTATAYDVERDGTVVKHVDLPAPLSCDDATAQAGSHYAIRAFNGPCAGPLSPLSDAVSPTVVPGAPGAPEATPGCASVRVHWAAPSPPFTGFKLYRGPTVIAASLADTARNFIDGAAGANATYTVAALNGDCEGIRSAASNSASPTTRPAAPAQPGVVGDCGRVTVSWTAVAGNVTEYHVYRAGNRLDTVLAPATTYVDSMPLAFAARYQVAAASGGCEGDNSHESNSVSATPAPGRPGTPVATSACGQINVRWSAPTGTFTGFRLYRNGVVLAPNPLPDTTRNYVDTGATGPVTYRVAALNGASCEGAPSDSSNVARIASPPAPPGAATATPGCNSIVVRWTASPTATITGYRIYRGSAPIFALDDTASSYTDDGPPAGSTYAVAALEGDCASVKSAYTPPVSPLALPGTPGRAVATPLCAALRVDWTAAPGAVAGYRLLRDGQPRADVGADVLTFKDDGAPAGSIYRVLALAVTSGCPGLPSVASEPAAPLALPTRPAAPSVEPGCGHITVGWTRPAEPLVRFRLTRNDGRVIFVGPAATSYVDTLPPLNSSYTLVVEADPCESSVSEPSAAESPLGAPQAPAAPTLAPGCTMIGLTWPGVFGATRYIILRGATRVDSVEATAPHAWVDRDPGVLPRSYAIAAANACGERVSDYSTATAGQSPGTPGNLVADGQCGRVRLTWQAVEGASRYLVYREGVKIDSVTAAIAWDDTQPGTASHLYAVAAVGSCGTSERSTGVSATARQVPGRPARPGLTAGCGTIHIEWSAVGGAASYTLRRDSQDLVSGLTVTSYTDSDPGVAQRCYTVVAVGGTACPGPESESACLTLAPCEKTVKLNIPASDVQGDNYRMITFPVQPTNPSIAQNIQDDLGPPDSHEWKMGHWVPTQGGPDGPGGYLETGHGLEVIAPGLGYWLTTRVARTVVVSGVPVSRSRFEIALDGPANSWHQVGNPYLNRVPMTELRVKLTGGAEEALAQTTLTDPVLQRWSAGQYVATDVAMDTLAGYWIHKLGAAPVTLIVPAPAGTAASPGPVDPLRPAAAAWSIVLRAGQNGRSSGEIAVGAAPVARDAWNSLSLALPPAPGGSPLELAVDERDWGVFSGLYASSYHPEDGAMNWELHLAGLRADALVHLDIAAPDLPADATARVIDVTDGETYSVSGDTQVWFTPRAESVSLRLVVTGGGGTPGSPPPAGAWLATPNPFRRSTRFELELERAASVDVLIYDASGRLVRPLRAAGAAAGRLTLTWDGRNAQGVELPGGVYFARWLLDGVRRPEPVRLVKLR